MVYSVEKKSYVDNVEKKSKRKVQGVPQPQTAALPRPQEEEEALKFLDINLLRTSLDF